MIRTDTRLRLLAGALAFGLAGSLLSPRATGAENPHHHHQPDHGSGATKTETESDQVTPHEAMPHNPVPPLTDADREAVIFGTPRHTVHDKAITWFLLLDQFEWQALDEGDGRVWDVTGWVGGDINRLWLRSEGERASGATEDAEVQVLWGHAISPWWDVVAGVRQDFKPGDPQTWGTIGLQGLALYSFEAEATAFVGENGQTAARLEGEYDILLTNRLILQPTAEVNLHGKDDPARGIGSGLSSLEVGLRLRYEIRREFAPYIGVAWSRSYGDTADLAREQGADVEDTRLVAGIRIWF